MASPEKELEEKLIETGNKLLNPPSAVDELLNLLDLVETYLSRVEQSPSKSTLNALGASMKALVSAEFLRHSDTDVKVAVASCISEITRITAPDAPYDDEQMKDIFQLIVAAFENLSDLSSRSYLKRVSILETVAKVRSCVVMLDLECDSLILEMFHQFFKAIRDEHPDNVFSSMETIMSMVLEESEDISLELLSSLLQSVKKEDNDLLCIARKLGEKVIVSCSSKLRPYLMQAVQSNDISLDQYNKVIVDIYQGSGDLDEKNQKDCSPKNEEAEKVDHTDVTSEPDHTPKSPKPKMINGTAENSDTLVDLKSSKEITDATTKSELDDLETKPTKPDSLTGKSARKTKTSKSSSLKQSKDMHEPSHREVSDDKRLSTGEADNMVSETSFVKETSSQEPDKDALLSPEPRAKHINQDSTRSKRGKQQSKKKNGNSAVDMSRSPADAGQKSNKKNETSGEATLTPAETEETASGEKVEPNVPLSSNINSKSESEGTGGPEKRSTGDNHGDDDISSLKKKSDGTSGSGTKISAKIARKRNADESTSIKEKENKKQLKETHSANKKTEAGDINKKKMTSPLKSSIKSLSKVSTSDENSIAKSKRKRVVGEVSEITYDESKVDENLVGAKIKVWWPDDKKFYEGSVASYNLETKKHKILYTDGDEEILQLKDERWKLIGDSGRGKTDVEKVLDSPERPQKKKTKSSPESSGKKPQEEQVKISGKSTTTSKSTETTPKSNMKTKSDSKQKSNTRTKADTPKTTTKSITRDITSKSSTRSKVDEAAKMGSKSKDALSKDVTKSKHDTPRTSNKSKTSPKSVGKSDTKSETPKSGTFKTPRMDREYKEKLLKSSKKPKSGTPKVSKESASKGKSTTSKSNLSEGSPKRKQNSAKANENDSKSGKKRRRNVNS